MNGPLPLVALARLNKFGRGEVWRIFYRLNPGIDTKGLQAVTLKCLAKTIRVIPMGNFAWRDVFHTMYGIGLDVGEEVPRIELDRQMLLEHEITHYDFVQKVSCCEIDPEMKFLYVPKHTGILTLIQGVAGISRVIEGMVIETHQSQFHVVDGSTSMFFSCMGHL